MRKIPIKRIGEYLQTALKIAIENGGSAPIRQIIEEMEKRLKFDEYERALLEKSGYVRWQSIMHFYSIDLTKAGWLRKHKGIWYVTEEGKDALKLGAENFIETASNMYHEWAKSRELVKEKEEPEAEETSIATSYAQAESISREEIKNFIKNLGPYEFQDLVAALLRGMGYFTPFVAPPGPDAGIDIVAYKDPIGAELPRIRVQVKHRPDTKVARAEIAALIGDLQGEGYIGVIVSTGGFSSESINEMRKANKHIERIDLDRFIDLWDEHYNKLSDEDKALLPLRRLPFLAPPEE